MMRNADRVALVGEIRARLVDLALHDAELLLIGFGVANRVDVEGWAEDRASYATHLLLHAEDDALVELASHLSVAAVDEAAAPQVTPGTPSALELFASHSSQHKLLVSAVARQLEVFGVILFVAHEDIAPDREWQEEILAQLGAAHGGIAFLHSEFKTSDWCDQEVGWLLGRGVPVLALKFDLAPYGPLGFRQAIPGAGKDAAALAGEILDVLTTRTELHGALASSLIEAMRQSPNFNTTDRVWSRLRVLRNLDTDQCRRLIDASEANTQVRWAHSPYDGGEAYPVAIRAFLREQPGAEAAASDIDGWEQRDSA